MRGTRGVLVAALAVAAAAAIITSACSATADSVAFGMRGGDRQSARSALAHLAYHMDVLRDDMGGLAARMGELGQTGVSLVRPDMRRMAAQMQGLQHQMVEMGGQTDQMALQIVADLDPNAAAGEIERMQERLAGIHQQAGEIRNEVTALRGLLRHENVPDILNELRTDLGNLRHDLGHVDEQMDGLSKQLAAIG